MLPTFPRVSLGFFPTPLHQLNNLSDYLGGPRIWIKRDDCSGLALGGNKVRKLEYILADARQQEADVLVTVGAVSSNHTRQTAAAAARLGLQCRLVLIGKPFEPKQGNYLLDELLGAATICVPNHLAAETIELIMNECRSQNKRPYFIPAGGHNVWGALAYRDAFQEIVEQADFPVDAVINALGTGTTHAGLLLGKLGRQHPAEIMGISVGGTRPWCETEILTVLRQAEDLFNLSPARTEDLNIEDTYIGEGYTRLYPQVREAIKLVAQHEGILLDPIYTGKAMVGLLSLIRQGYYRRGQNVVFLHSGGAPEIFSSNRFLCAAD